MNRQANWTLYWPLLLFVPLMVFVVEAQQSSPQLTRQTLEVPPHRVMAGQYCVLCHNENLKTGGLALDLVLKEGVERHAEVWEKVVRKLRARQMPPPGMARPDEAAYQTVISWLESTLDEAAAADPNPGRTESLRRLNRTEYRNAVRDLLDLDPDVSSLLPEDQASHGFDNVTVVDLSPTLLDRYLSAAQKISRLAVGRGSPQPTDHTVRIKPDLTQEGHLEGLPLGTRGGAVIEHDFPVDGDYDLEVRLARDRNEHVEGLSEPHELELLLDGRRLRLFTIQPAPRGEGHENVDRHLKLRVPVTAGPHEVGAAFIKKPTLVLETERQPYEAHFNFYRHPRIQPALYSISIVGPHSVSGPGDSPSRRRIFDCRPEKGREEDCARSILARLLRRAYRRPVSEEDLARPLDFFRNSAAKDGFEAGIETALTAILVSPQFLFRIERDPEGIRPGTAYPVSDLELASRLSFFLWSSIPDEELLESAVAGTLRQGNMLEQQVRRMLADRRSASLVDNFAAQWLQLRNLESITPDMRLFPDFDDNLRQAFRRETELLLETIIREDRSLLDLLRADFTFVNERLAKHYGIPHVYGSRFRPVPLDGDSRRGGLLRHGSILTLTSYPTRTSPVIRGHWIMENLLGLPPPPPPPDVPNLKDNTVDGKLSVRARLSEHRSNPVCSGCHNLMDPVGLSLENFDAVGRWREFDSGEPIDSSGGLPDGSRFVGVDGLEQALLSRPEMFVETFLEKMLTFALGRGVDYYDAPALRAIVSEARADDFRLSTLVLGVVKSTPFQMRKAP